MNLLIVPFIETTVPLNLEENDCGVAMHTLIVRGSCKSQKTQWSIQIMSINGIWYGASDANTPISGYGESCTRHWTTPFTNVEDCIDYYHKRVCEFFRANGKGTPPRPSFSDFADEHPYDHYKLNDL